MLSVSYIKWKKEQKQPVLINNSCFKTESSRFVFSILFFRVFYSPLMDIVCLESVF